MEMLVYVLLGIIATLSLVLLWRLSLDSYLKWSEVDIVVMHKLMIEADEETYLQTANKLAPIWSGDWDD